MTFANNWIGIYWEFQYIFACCHHVCLFVFLNLGVGCGYFHHFICKALVSHVQWFMTCIIGNGVIMHTKTLNIKEDVEWTYITRSWHKAMHWYSCSFYLMYLYALHTLVIFFILVFKHKTKGLQRLLFYTIVLCQVWILDPPPFFLVWPHLILNSSTNVSFGEVHGDILLIHRTLHWGTTKHGDVLLCVCVHK